MRQAANGSDERRQLTALFCDFVGSTELSANLDPEDYYEVVRAYHELAAGLVVDYGGHVAHCLGDGLVAYFALGRFLTSTVAAAGCEEPQARSRQHQPSHIPRASYPALLLWTRSGG